MTLITKSIQDIYVAVAEENLAEAKAKRAAAELDKEAAAERLRREQLMTEHVKSGWPTS